MTMAEMKLEQLANEDIGVAIQSLHLVQKGRM